MMPMFSIVLCVLGLLGASLCMNESEDDGNYTDNYDNEISQDQQGEETTPCKSADVSHWDKLFIALEDSHMRQNMLFDSLGQCCGGLVSLQIQMDKLAKGTCQQCLPRLESVCREQTEQVRVRLQQSLTELSEEEAQRERNLNATLQQLLHRSHEWNVLLKRLEENRNHRTTPSAGDSKMRHRPTQMPGGLGATFGLGIKPMSSFLKEQDVTSALDMTTVESNLVAVATELQKVHLQLIRVIEQVGTLRKDT